MYLPSIAIGLAATGLLLLSFGAVCSDRFWRGLAQGLLLTIVIASLLIAVAGSQRLGQLHF